MNVVWRLSLLGSVFGLAALTLTPTPAQAVCTANGSVVTCTGIDEDGFIGGNNLTINIDQTTFVQSIYDGNPDTLCPVFRSALRLGDNATVNNRGLMLGRGNCGLVIEAQNGLRFTNDGDIRTDAEVAFAVLMGDRFAIVNNGPVSTVNSGSTAFVGGSNGTFVNSTTGLITTSGADSSGVFAENNNTITNDGRIITTNSGSFGIDVGASNTIVNTGTISTSAIATFGINLRGVGNTVTNRGTIATLPNSAPRDGEDAVGILALQGNTTITNTGTISGDYAGVELSGTNNRFTNDGTVTARATPASTQPGGAVFIDTGSATVINTGTIRGTGTAAVRTRAGASLSLTNTGRIEGDVVMGSASGSINLGTGSVITGTIFGATNNATVLSLSGTGTLSNPMVNMGSLQQVTDGSWTLARRYDVQAVIQQVGTLVLTDGIRVNGTLFNQAGSRLTGVGTVQRINPAIGGNASLAGTLSPGLNSNPGAVMGVQGNLSLQPGARLEFDVSSTANDRVDVGGTISGSANVFITYAGAPVRDGQTFTLMTGTSITSPTNQSCAGTIVEGTALGTGCFTVADNVAAFVRTSLIVSANSVVARAQRQSFTSAAATANERSLAAALDRVVATTTTATPLIALLDQQSTADARTTLSNITTDLPVASQTWGLLAANAMSTAMAPWLELSPVDSPRGQWRTWGTLFARSGERGSKIDSANFDYEVRGVLAGADYAVTDGTRVGLAASHSSGETQFAVGAANSELSTTTVGAYVSYAGSEWRGGAGVNLSDGRANSSRIQTIGGATTPLSSRADTGGESAYVQASYATSQAGWLVKPTVSLSYARAKVDQTDERGAAGLAFQDETASTLRGDIGVRAIAKPGPIHLSLAVFWSQNFKDVDRSARARISSLPGSDFVITGIAEKRGWLNTQVGVNIEILPGLMGRMIWSGILNDRLGGHMASAGVSYRF
jgi:uncharacterized protein with beta-barrel porin domain